ncbi:type I-B CRISPR-associated endonuclease Cas1b [Clostridium cochlearium]|uniref:CRISPR-associated endonuclease Cas1 n=1 Tax=Clostridium cochlearium TaxID=1494 RepID=A0A2X2WBT2_CLOCO|nr:type I-B CRISPR-associated endonuclease Cas1b [Clostridium cochlearium]MBU5270428.1 type I-B CRISPR-associated endonuclease Cas1b [Clostridium cochlearium]SQB33505.1 CRISPR-associated Cas1 family protein [Clostridium cochlearium]
MKKDIYIFNDGDLKKKDNTLYFESDGKKKYIPVEEINNLYVFSEITLNKRFLDFASQKEICIHFFNYFGYYMGTFYPREHLNSGYVILNQAKYYLDYDKRLDLAKRIINTAIYNIIVVLRYYKNRGIELEEEINNIEYKQYSIDTLESIEELMAIEGNIRETYYKTFAKIIKNKEFEFTVRSRRPPLDKINALISFGNSLMYSTVLGEIYETHLDPRIGYLHSTNMRRFTLNLDVAEIFKPIIVDRIIFSLLNRKVITEKDFEKNFNGILLTDKGKMKFLKEYNDKLYSTIKHRKLNRNVSYKRLIRMELYKIQKHIIEDEPYEGFVMNW